MSIPPEIQSLIDRLNLELETIEREGTEGEN
ncbi:MAG: restriction endonuclease subunit S, partial [Cyanobacteria bacterium J083]